MRSIQHMRWTGAYLEHVCKLASHLIDPRVYGPVLEAEGCIPALQGRRGAARAPAVAVEITVTVSLSR
jgi:hypothetical protein